MVNLIDLNKNKHLFRRKSSLISSKDPKYYKINLKDIAENSKKRIKEDSDEEIRAPKDRVNNVFSPVFGDGSSPGKIKQEIPSVPIVGGFNR